MTTGFLSEKRASGCCTKANEIPRTRSELSIKYFLLLLTSRVSSLQPVTEYSADVDDTKSDSSKIFEIFPILYFTLVDRMVENFDLKWITRILTLNFRGSILIGQTKSCIYVIFSKSWPFRQLRNFLV